MHYYANLFFFNFISSLVLWSPIIICLVKIAYIFVEFDPAGWIEIFLQPKLLFKTD